MAGSWKKILFSDDVLAIRKNSGAYLTTRQKLNFIEGSNITLTVADDGDEIDTTIDLITSPSLTGNLTIPDQETNTDSTNGIIYKAGTPFIHNFRHPTGNTKRPDGYNTFMGLGAGNLTMGSTATQTYHSSYNTAIGASALYKNTKGYYNTAIGASALYTNTEGDSNTAVDREALYTNNTSSYNTAIGASALYNNSTGDSNTATGMGALYTNNTGHDNTAIGKNAGRYIADGSTANQTSTTSCYLGSETKALADGDTNEIVIGYNAIGLGSNTAVIGNDSIVTTALKGNVGIGTTSPGALLHVNGNIIATKNNKIGFTYASDDPGPYQWITSNGADALRFYNTYTSSLTTKAYSFYGNPSGTTEILTILHGGKVGIGTTSPTAMLDVNSDILRLRTAKTPASATATGNAGDICWDSDYVYCCVAENQWKRAALSSW